MKSKHTNKKTETIFLILATIVGHLYIYSWLILFAFSDTHATPIKGDKALELLMSNWIFFFWALLGLTSIQFLFSFRFERLTGNTQRFFCFLVFNLLIFLTEIYLKL